MYRTTTILGAIALLAACSSKKVNEQPIMENGDRVPSTEVTVAVAQEQVNRDRAIAEQRQGELMADALATCSGAICEAVTRGEVVIGMTTPQVLAATRTTEDAWSIRQSGNATVLAPATRLAAPSDAVGELALVQLRDGRVMTYGYRESQGMRLVSNPSEATTAGVARSRADALIREGDDYAARGDLDAALDRYDRASVLSMDDPMLEYRIATVLDKALRPIEAQLRYRMFLHRMELERIDAVGQAYANIAAAMVHARERIIVLERQGR